ncbi:hypothetical protein [Micromonospora sp. KC721]|uniref:DUF7003 family protein n=1 Tax=Micromonospora sp. KC721 TaxID=2530380 RepID=UPI00104578BF|nr:hypothetical protein [Micromonospora sp. KC721]TDB82045.1 hypothetical protein E1182_02765 [Micromonospora sp. KC721]
MNSEHILAELDRAAATDRFGQLEHPYRYLVTARLHAYSDAARWALLMETVGYDPRAGNVVDVLHPVGNCVVGESPAIRDRHLGRVDNMAELFDEDAEWPWLFRQVPLVIRGQQIHLDAPPHIEPEELFRMLVPQHRELLLADESELRQLIPADLPEVLRLEDWHHEVLIPLSPYHHTSQEAGRLILVGPSDIEAYQQIAQVLATADAALYRPTLPPNTDWRNWPMSGRL